MKVRELKNILELEDEAAAGKQLVGISHWIVAIFKAKEYDSGNPKDIDSLKRLEKLNLVVLKEEKGIVKARLSETGRKLYQDFYAHGYYL